MNYTIVGAARSGLAAASLAKELGLTVFVTESKTVEQMPEAKKKLTRDSIDSEFGGNSEKALLNTDCVIVSPGVPPTARILIEAETRGIEIISELEFAYRNCKNPIIAITGTNGKTTTTTLMAYILNRSGKKAIACGNIGSPMSAYVNHISPDTILVAEISSYQLDRVKTFRPDVAMILNITPDHLSYHGSLENYISAKYKIFSMQNEKDLLILNADDAATLAAKNHATARIAYFSMNPVENGIYREGEAMVARFSQHNEGKIMFFEEIRIPGVHNAYNSMAAALAARAFEIRNEDIRDSLMSFQGVEHRLELVRTFDGIDFVNDSKATNINATWYAFSSYNRPLIWIAGGRGDNNDYSELDELVGKNVKSIVVIGEESDNIFNHFCLKKRVQKSLSLEDAVLQAKDFAEEGDIVLFSPACKSFDMFMNYEHRGEVFKQAVMDIK